MCVETSDVVVGDGRLRGVGAVLGGLIRGRDDFHARSPRDSLGIADLQTVDPLSFFGFPATLIS